MDKSILTHIEIPFFHNGALISFTMPAGVTSIKDARRRIQKMLDNQHPPMKLKVTNA